MHYETPGQLFHLPGQTIKTGTCGNTKCWIEKDITRAECVDWNTSNRLRELSPLQSRKSQEK